MCILRHLKEMEDNQTSNEVTIHRFNSWPELKTSASNDPSGLLLLSNSLMTILNSSPVLYIIAFTSNKVIYAYKIPGH